MTITVSANNSPIFDISKTTPGSHYKVNVDGLLDPDTTGFGGPLGGTYVGVGDSTLPAGYDPNPNIANPGDSVNVSTSFMFQGQAGAVYVNGANVINLVTSTTNTSPAGLDPNFINNTVHTFELAGILLPAGQGTVANAGFVPFANIVLPVGVSATAIIMPIPEEGAGGVYTVQIPAVVPEPSGIGAITLGTLGLFSRRRRLPRSNLSPL